MRILVLEDSEVVKELMRGRLEKAGHTVELVDNGHQGFILATSQPYDVLITDLQMPHWDGFKFIEAMEVVSPRVPIIIVTASDYAEDEEDRIASYANVIGLFKKPLDFPSLFVLLESVTVQTHANVSKKARIVCTIGPASDGTEVLSSMILAGMDVARLNFSHGTYDQHEKTLANIREAEAVWGKPIAVLQDLCGPKIRIGAIEDGAILLRSGQRLTLCGEPVVGTPERISAATPEILPDLRRGDPLLLDDGLLELRVIREGTAEVVCEVVSGGILKANKGMNLPATPLSLPSVTDKDWRDLEWGLNHSVDYVALSFVRQATEISRVKEYIRRGGKPQLKVVAKIEKPEAVRNIRDIIQVADAIMIARGDMGVELPAARVPRIQQELIKLCWQENIPVITATQMLDSMTTNSRPTRAEVTDVSMAIREGTDAVMLSQETATGVDPVNVIRTMASIIGEEEQYTGLSSEQYEQLITVSSTNPALAAVAGLTDTAAVILIDLEGVLYPMVSKWNRKVPTLLVTSSTTVARQASLYRNILPMIIQEELSHNALIRRACDIGLEWGYLRSRDTVAVVEGQREVTEHLDQVGALQILRIP